MFWTHHALRVVWGGGHWAWRVWQLGPGGLVAALSCLFLCGMGPHRPPRLGLGCSALECRGSARGPEHFLLPLLLLLLILLLLLLLLLFLSFLLSWGGVAFIILLLGLGAARLVRSGLQPNLGQTWGEGAFLTSAGCIGTCPGHMLRAASGSIVANLARRPQHHT